MVFVILLSFQFLTLVCVQGYVTTQPSRPPPIQPIHQPNCKDPNGVSGNCIEIRKCPAILNEFLSRPKDLNYVKYIQKSNVNCNRNGQDVCCPIYNSHTPPTKSHSQHFGTQLLTPETGCGFANASHNRFLNGDPAKVGTWPWIALIGYTNNLGKIEFKCGGSLISHRHILTAAQCIRNSLKLVRLGEHNLDVDDETRHIDIPVVKMVIHPNYDKKDGHSDLAILYLGQDVHFTHLIHPICIPFEEPLKSKNYEKYTPFLGGWGRGIQECDAAENIIREVQTTVLNNQKCAEKYKENRKLVSTKQFDNSVLCSGYLRGRKDICEVDIGGPLMSPNPNHQLDFYFYQIGVASYGFGNADVYVPAVYVRVQAFTDWIAEQLAEPIK